jgi:hypothetical protein
VDIVANANNIAYLHYLASRLKTVGDAAYPGDVRQKAALLQIHSDPDSLHGRF